MTLSFQTDKEVHMRVIETKHDLRIAGYGFIPAGTRYSVERYNQRYVYVKVNSYCTLRLARKGDCKIIY